MLRILECVLVICVYLCDLYILVNLGESDSLSSVSELGKWCVNLGVGIFELCGL